MTAVWLVGAALAVLGAVALIARRLLTVITVDGVSMQPTYAAGDGLLTLRPPLGRLRAGRPIVVRGRAVHGPSLLVKRLVALPGDAVPASVRDKVAPDDIVPPGRIVVLGDNPAASGDSRHWGYLDIRDVHSVVIGSIGGRSGNYRQEYSGS